jgi:glutamate synthase (ferredoxin)
MQVFVEGKPGQTGDALERELFIARKLVERAKVAALPADVASDFYFCTLSNRTIVYKVGGSRAGAAACAYQQEGGAGLLSGCSTLGGGFETRSTGGQRLVCRKGSPVQQVVCSAGS